MPIKELKVLLLAGKKAWKKPEDKAIAAFLIVIGFAVRLFALGSFPGGINQDEAYSAYEAYCLLTDGMDSWGYRYPVYLTAWGSGMNALQSYLMMPFVALFGLETWVLRMPQALIACISLPAIFTLLEHLADRKTALTGLAFLAICPWHISMARWGLESNLAPGLVLLGFLFFVMGLSKPRFFVLSGLFYGLSLYAYATIWPVLPFMIVLHVLYAAYTGRLKWSRWLFAGAALLGILALPLIFFLVVNWGWIDEIRTSVISIPKILQMRMGDISLDHLYENVYRMVKTFLLQRDDMVWNASDQFGLYYHVSLPFIVIGVFGYLVSAVRSICAKQFDGGVLILVWLMSGAVLGCLIDGNVNRLNFLHFPLILCAVHGIRTVCTWAAKRIRGFSWGLAGLYGVCFVFFAGFYFTDYQEMIAPQYSTGLEEAVAFAEGVAEDDIRVSDQISYPKILFYGKVEPDVFRETVVWNGEPSAFMSIESVDRYRFGVSSGDMLTNVCIVKAQEMPDELPPGIRAEVFEQIAVVYPADPDAN